MDLSQMLTSEQEGTSAEPSSVPSGCPAYSKAERCPELHVFSVTKWCSFLTWQTNPDQQPKKTDLLGESQAGFQAGFKLWSFLGACHVFLGEKNPIWSPKSHFLHYDQASFQDRALPTSFRILLIYFYYPIFTLQITWTFFWSRSHAVQICQSSIFFFFNYSEFYSE